MDPTWQNINVFRYGRRDEGGGAAVFDGPGIFEFGGGGGGGGGVIERHPLMKSSSAVPKLWLPRLRYYTESPTPQDTRRRTVPGPSSRRHRDRPFELGARTALARCTLYIHTYTIVKTRTRTQRAPRVESAVHRASAYTQREPPRPNGWSRRTGQSLQQTEVYIISPHRTPEPPSAPPPTPRDSRASSSERPGAAAAAAAVDISLLGVFWRCSFFEFLIYNM